MEWIAVDPGPSELRLVTHQPCMAAVRALNFNKDRAQPEWRFLALGHKCYKLPVLPGTFFKPSELSWASLPSPTAPYSAIYF